MIKVYLDTSLIKRPFDDQSQPRIWLEANALSFILQMAIDGLITFVASAVQDFENHRNTLAPRKAWMERCLAMASERVELDPGRIVRAGDFEAKGLKALDALHLSCAEYAGCDYFVTCDDDVLRSSPDAGPTIVGPEELIRRVAGGSR
jgi:predicted nucleic acid-binding protein